MRAILIGLAMVLGVMVAPGAAEANRFSIIGAGCIPDGSTANQHKVSTGGHGVNVNGVGTSRFICPIPHFDSGSWSNLLLYYKNTSAFGHKVRAYLRYASIGSDASVLIMNCESYYLYSGSLCSFPSFTPSASRWYWVEVFVDRPEASINPEFLGININ